MPLLRKNAPGYNNPVFFYRSEMVLPSSNCNDIHAGNVEINMIYITNSILYQLDTITVYRYIVVEEGQADDCE